MERFKRAVSLVLCLVMVLGFLPMNVFAATGSVIDAAIFCSDVHGNASVVSSAFSGIKSADSTFDPSTATFVGDTQMAASSVTSAAQSVYSDVACYYAYGNHDSEGDYGISDVTGLLYSGENYYIYAISQTSMASSNPDTTGFTSTVAGLDKSKPLFIASHLPLHDRRGDSNGAAAWYEAISAAAESMDIVFFWAHNHTGENEVDEAAFYVAKDGDETFTLENTSTVVTPNFTYMNAGFVGKSSSRGGVVTTVKIYSDALVFQDYTSSGAFTGEYSHNVEVAREFATTTEGGDGDSGSTDATDSTEATGGETTTEEKEVYVLVDTMTVGKDYLIANGNSGTVTLLGQSGGSDTTTTAEVKTSGDYTYIETADSGYVWNATAHPNSSYSSYPRLINAESYAMYASSGSLAFSSSLTSTSGAVYTRYWTYTDGQLACVSTNSGSTTYYLTYDDGYSMTSTATDGIYIYEKQTIEVESDGSSSGDSGSTDEGEDDTTTGGDTETVVGDGTYTTAEDGSYQKVTFGSTTTETKTVYVLTSSITSGTAYLIANSNSAGSAYVVANNSGSVAATGVTVVEDDTIGTYIELTDATDELWTASGSSSTTLKNGSYYLYGSGSDLSLSTSNSRTWSWSSSNSRLSYSSGSGNKAKTYYLVYGDSGWDTTSTSDNVYFYVPTEISTTVDTTKTYEVTASDIEHFYTADTTDTETVTISKSVTNGTPDGAYSYEIVSDEDGIISGEIAADGTITLTGAEGTAQVKVSYTWTDGDNTYTIWQVIDVTGTSPYYTLDLHKAVYTFNEASITEFASGVTYYEKDSSGNYVVTTDTVYDSTKTYYTISVTPGELVEETIALKGIVEGDKYSLWAIIKEYDGVVEDGEDGKDLGDVDDNRIYWESSDTSIATVDPATGIITFTGKDGKVEISAYYLDESGELRLCGDTVEISVTASKYSVPADGTKDFPEYPNEGAIRYDKTAVAVGNFSETGIAQVELSMTGVPYTTGSEIDVVLMLDITGSMHDVTISSYTYSKYARVEYTILASQAFVESIVVNEDGSYNGNRVGVYSFNSDGTFTLLELGTISSADELAAAKAAIATLNDDYASGGTPYDDGLSKVQSVLTTAKTDGTGNNRQQFAIFMTDGVPTDYEYITGSTHANYSSASSIAGMLTSSDNYCTRDTDYYYEYYSTEMKGNGVTVYSVGIGLENTNSAWSGTAAQCLNLASRLLNDISGPAGETTQPDAVGTSTLSKQDSYFFSVADADAATEMENVFQNIAVQILQAATDVTVEDRITDEYTMIFDIPTGSVDISGELTGQEFYIEFLKYTLDANHERTDSGTSVTKLYLGVDSNGAYYAASDASGTAYAAPVFEQKVIGEKGTLYYWTIDDTYSGKAAVTYTNSDDTYYFIPYGKEANEDGTAPEGWYNMTSGAYAYGTIDSTTHMSTDLVIATPYFVYNASTKMLYWTVDKLDTTEYALTYFLYLDNSATEVGKEKETDAGTYPTNDHAYITYTNFRGNDCRQVFPIPQLTWNGAQVSYVFYLVNAAGQPINKSGQIVDFANATFVTDIYTTAVVWNKGEDGTVDGESNLSIDWLAENLLPDDYTVYDENASYELKVYADATGESIFNYFIIGGSTAADISTSLNSRLNLTTTSETVSEKTTKVYNTKAGVKYDKYGTYTSKDATNMTGETILSSFDFANTTVAFAVVWQPKLVPDVVVVDYGLDVLINVVQNDLMQNIVSGIGTGKEAYGGTAMNTGIATSSMLGTAALNIDGNTVTIENENQIRFHQNDMEFTKEVVFYYESPASFYENSQQKIGYMYSSVTVIPATTIYYEDDFVTYEGFTWDYTNSKWAEKDSLWTVAGTTSGATQQQDRPGASQISADLDADNLYGYDGAYAEMSTYSNGSSRVVTVDYDNYATAQFTFWGTGFDIISLTSHLTGGITMDVYVGDSSSTTLATYITKNADGEDITVTHQYAVDTFYGYEYVAGDADGDGTIEDGEYVWQVDPDADDTLYQVPVMKLTDLTYGQYTVKIKITHYDLFDHGQRPAGTKIDETTTTQWDSYDFYLDAIRIYDPAYNAANVDGSVTQKAYLADGEGWPSYIELRNGLISRETLSNAEEDAQIVGEVFIDGDPSVGDNQISDYISYGPNNEVYLASGQSIAFLVSAPDNLAKLNIGISSADGKACNYSIANISAATDPETNDVVVTSYNEKTFTVKSTTDMYYDLTAWKDGVIVIKNTGTGIMSLTNIKATYTSNPTDEAAIPVNETNTVALASNELMRVSTGAYALNTASAETEAATEATVAEEETAAEPELVYVYMTVEAADLVLAYLNAEEEIPEETIPETTEPEATEPETTEPETTEPETTEPETTEPETTEPETTEPETTEPEATEPEATEPEDESDGNRFWDIIGIIIGLIGKIFG